MHRTGIAMGVLALGLPLASEAAELIVGVSGASAYRSNEFRSEQNPTDSIGFVLSPTLAVTGEGRRSTYTANYRPWARIPVDDSTGSQRLETNHQATLGFGYTLFPRTQLFFRDNFSSVENTLAGEVADPDLDPNPIEDVDETARRTLRNAASLNLSHRFSSRWTGNLGASHLIQIVDADRFPDITVLGASGSLGYRFSQQFSAELGGNYSRTFFSDRDSRDAVLDASRSTSVQAFLGFEYRFSPTFRIRANAGPALVVSDRPSQRIRQFAGTNRFVVDPVLGVIVDPNQDPNEPRFQNLDSCLQPLGGGQFTSCFSNFPALNAHVLTVQDSDIPPSLGVQTAAELAARTIPAPLAALLDDDTFTFFAEAGIDKSWQDLRLSLTYRRTENPNSGFGANSVVDSVTGSGRWQIDRDWWLEFGAGWNQRQAIVDSAINVGPIFADSGVIGTDPLGVTHPVAELVGQLFTASRQTLDVTQYNARLKLWRQITRRVSASLDGSVLFQRPGGSVASRTAGKFEDYRAGISFRYEFAPYRF